MPSDRDSTSGPIAPTTRSGLPIRSVYGPADLRERLPPPGEFPFTRGIHSEMYRRKPWTMRQYAGFGTPEETNERFRYLLAQGQTGLSLALDLPTQLGLDADCEQAQGEVGRVGVSVSSVQDLEAVLAGIPLAQVSTSMTINATAGILLAMYEAAARAQGVSPGLLKGTVQNDPLKEFGARGAWIYPIAPSMRLAADLIEDCVLRLPRFNPISIASHYRDAGATPAEEMAFTLSAGISYVEECLRRGLEVDRFAPRLSFFFYTYTNFFEEVAKVRAGRRLWAKLMKERFGATAPASQMMRAACVCGGNSLTRAEPLNNIARTTLEAFAVACAGVQSVFTAAFDEAYAIPSELSARTALRVQQIVALETEVAKTADPLGGSYFVEALTDELEAAICRVIEEIDDQGGMVQALESGWVQRRLALRAYEHQRAVDRGELPVVGVNVHRSSEEPEPPFEPQKASPQATAERSAALAGLRRSRSSATVARALSALRRAAEGRENLMPFIREAVTALATTGEISGALLEVFGEYRPPTGV
ncbi:MAG: methylmalonyl-CoA mutase [Myxococcales bacterium]|nr:methylmalonyl-CoA mutase [Myxococcales bacterium]